MQTNIYLWGGGNYIKDVVKFYLEWEVTVFFSSTIYKAVLFIYYYYKSFFSLSLRNSNTRWKRRQHLLKQVTKVSFEVSSHQK